MDSLQVIYHDSAVIIISKAHNVLSVPGREFRCIGETLSRSVQWGQAIKSIAKKVQSNPQIYPNIVVDVIFLLEQRHMFVPRQRVKFFRFIERNCKIEEEEKLKIIWEILLEEDKALNTFDLSKLPQELISAADLVEIFLKGTKVHHVHRLDQETSGLLLFALSTESASDLCRQFRDREIEKVYVALVHGILSHSEGIIDAPLGADPLRKPYQIVDFTNGKDSKTFYRVINKENEYFSLYRSLFPSLPTNIETSLLLLKPLTGRTHQLRVHSAYLGHPIVGDSLYSTHLNYSGVTSRLFLHAYKINFKHPMTKAQMNIIAHKQL